MGFDYFKAFGIPDARESVFHPATANIVAHLPTRPLGLLPHRKSHFHISQSVLRDDEFTEDEQTRRQSERGYLFRIGHIDKFKIWTCWLIRNCVTGARYE